MFASVGIGVTLQLCEWTNRLHMTNLCLNHQVHGLRVSYFTLIVLLVGGRLTSAWWKLLVCHSFPIFSWHCLPPCGILFFILSTEKPALCLCVCWGGISLILVVTLCISLKIAFCHGHTWVSHGLILPKKDGGLQSKFQPLLSLLISSTNKKIRKYSS